MRIHVLSNSLGSGDFFIVTVEGEPVFHGKSLGAQQLVELLDRCKGHSKVTFVALTDEQLEEVNFSSIIAGSLGGPVSSAQVFNSAGTRH